MIHFPGNLVFNSPNKLDRQSLNNWCQISENIMSEINFEKGPVSDNGSVGVRRCDTQQNNTHNDIYQNNTQHKNTQQNDTQHSTKQYSA